MKVIKKNVILIYIIGFVIARASFLGINPIAIGFFTSAYLEKVSPGLLFITILVVMISRVISVYIPVWINNFSQWSWPGWR